MCPLKERLSNTFQPLIGLCFVLSELARHLVKIKLSIKCIHVYRWEKPWLIPLSCDRLCKVCRTHKISILDHPQDPMLRI